MAADSPTLPDRVGSGPTSLTEHLLSARKEGGQLGIGRRLDRWISCPQAGTSSGGMGWEAPATPTPTYLPTHPHHTGPQGTALCPGEVSGLELPRPRELGG